MHTTLNPLLLAALFAPVNDPKHEDVLRAITPPFAEPAPGPGVFNVSASDERDLRAYINLEEISEGWAWQDTAPDATKENFHAHLVAKIGVELFDRGEKLIRRAQAWDEDYERAKPAAAEWERRRCEHALLAPRIAFAEALLRQVPGTVTCAQVPMPEYIFGAVPEDFAQQIEAFSESSPTLQAQALRTLTPQQQANAAQGLPTPSLQDLAETWQQAEEKRQQAEADAGAERREKYLRYAAECFSTDFAQLLRACDAEGIQYMLVLREEEKQAVETGKAFHQVAAEVVFGLEVQQGIAQESRGRRVVVVHYRAPSTLAVSRVGDFKFSQLGAHWFAVSPETIGRLAARLQKDLVNGIQ